MTEVEFIALSKRAAVKKALHFWVTKLIGVHTLKEFLLHCSWRKEGKDYIVTYISNISKIPK